MALIGAGINTLKGLLTRVLNKKKIKKLERIHESGVLDLISWENRAQAAISLKQTHHLQRVIEGASREELSGIEKEIVLLMEDNINEKRVDLASQEATQLDVANLLVTIQKFATEAANEIDKQANSISSFKKSCLTLVKNESEKSRRRSKYYTAILIFSILLSTVSLLKAVNVL